MNIALTAYLLSLAVFIPASGKIADRFGSRTIFRLAILLFTVGSVLCGRADGLPLVGRKAVVARVIRPLFLDGRFQAVADGIRARIAARGLPEAGAIADHQRIHQAERRQAVSADVARGRPILGIAGRGGRGAGTEGEDKDRSTHGPRAVTPGPA